MSRVSETLKRWLGGSRASPPAAEAAADPDQQTEYERRKAREIEHFSDQVNVHELPEIFHYWSNKYLLPMFQPFGFNSPDDFFLVYLRRIAEARQSEPLRFVSLGAGNGDMEVTLAGRLRELGIENFVLECGDINETMLERGREMARGAGVSDLMRFEIADFNQWRPRKPYDAVIANQCLHHVVELEDLFKSIRRNLRPDGYFLTSDMIGRNGHMRWPEALEMVNHFWKELPERYKYNQQLKRLETEYQNHDCSTESFEGIRAQDILPLLNDHFHFELFVGFANVIDLFVDRSFGHNFDADSEEDRAFIDRVHAEDVVALENGVVKPTHMIAAMTTTDTGKSAFWSNLSPEFSIREPDEN